jgi:hypothetical protein
MRRLRARQSAGFYTGRRLVRLPAIGRASPFAPVSPMGAAAGVPVSNPARPGGFMGFSGPGSSRLSRQPTGVSGRERGSHRRERDQAAESAARAAPWGRLGEAQKVCTPSPVFVVPARRLGARFRKPFLCLRSTRVGDPPDPRSPLSLLSPRSREPTDLQRVGDRGSDPGLTCAQAVYPTTCSPRYPAYIPRARRRFNEPQRLPLV